MCVITTRCVSPPTRVPPPHPSKTFHHKGCSSPAKAHPAPVIHTHTQSKKGGKEKETQQHKMLAFISALSRHDNNERGQSHPFNTINYNKVQSSVPRGTTRRKTIPVHPSDPPIPNQSAYNIVLDERIRAVVEQPQCQLAVTHAACNRYWGIAILHP